MGRKFFWNIENLISIEDGQKTPAKYRKIPKEKQELLEQNGFKNRREVLARKKMPNIWKADLILFLADDGYHGVAGRKQQERRDELNGRRKKSSANQEIYELAEGQVGNGAS